MGKLKTKQNDTIRLEVRKGSSPEKSPWISAFVYRFMADTRGELAGQGDLSDCRNRQDVVRQLGEIVLANSKVIRNWMRRTGIEEDPPS